MCASFYLRPLYFAMSDDAIVAVPDTEVSSTQYKSKSDA